MRPIERENRTGMIGFSDFFMRQNDDFMGIQWDIVGKPNHNQIIRISHGNVCI